MRSAGLLKALMLAVLLVSCRVCPPLESHDRAPSGPSSSVKSAPRGYDFRATSTLQGIELQEAISALESREATQQTTEELPPDTLIELARFCFILGESKGKFEGGPFYEKGQRYAELLARREPSRVEGHYWLALNLCGIAETSRVRLALKLIPVIVGELELALSSDETYEQAGPHRVIGRIYGLAPAWPISEGDIGKSLEHLRKAVGITPENSTNHLYLAETLLQLGMVEEAHRELERVLTSTQNTSLAVGLKDDHKQAILLIGQIKEDGRESFEVRPGIGD